MSPYDGRSGHSGDQQSPGWASPSAQPLQHRHPNQHGDPRYSHAQGMPESSDPYRNLQPAAPPNGYWNAAPPPRTPEPVQQPRQVSGSRSPLPTPPSQYDFGPPLPPPGQSTGSTGRRPLPKPPGFTPMQEKPRGLPSLPPQPTAHSQQPPQPQSHWQQDWDHSQQPPPMVYFGGATYPDEKRQAGPSRTSSQAYSFSSNSETIPSRSTSQSYHDTPPSSLNHSIDYGLSAGFSKLEPVRGVSPLPGEQDGRNTPTQQNWANYAEMRASNRVRHISTSTIGTMDARLPPTPPNIPHTTLQHQRSFMDLPRNDSDGSAMYSVASSPYEPDPHRHLSTDSSLASIPDRRRSSELSASWAAQSQPPAQWVERKLQIHQTRRRGEDGELLDEEEEDYEDGWDEEEEAEVNEIRFFQPAFLSEAAVQLRDKVDRRRHLKAGIAWVGSFTGKDIVTTIQTFLPVYTREAPNDRRFALIMAQSLQNQLWFVEVDWDIKPLRDSSEDVFRFMGEMEGMGSGDAMTTELPKGLMTMATRCYSPSCSGDSRCYSPRCPYKTPPETFLQVRQVAPTPPREDREGWKEDVDPRLLHRLSSQQVDRQTIIRQAIQSEMQYEADLTAMKQLFIDDLYDVIPAYRLDGFISDVFGNAMELRETCRRIIDNFSIRQREQHPFIRTVGDIFLEAATDFRLIYPEYTGNVPSAELVIKKELEENPQFRLFNERVVRENDRRRDIKYLVARPTNQLQRYPAVLEAILNATEPDDPDRDFLSEALNSIRNLSAISQLKIFHASKGRGAAGKKQWFDLVPEEQRQDMPKKEQKRQMQIWELIQGEMEYVADLETIDELFVGGLREADIPIIERSRLDDFLDQAFHNYRSLLNVHQGLLDRLQARQIEQHPTVGGIADLIFDAALNWQEAYMEYVTHYPIAKAKVQEEQTRNPRFAQFLETCLKNPMSNRQDIYHFINRPIPRLLRYNLLLADILKSLQEVTDVHPDIETIPQVMELIGLLGKATQKGVAVNEAKVELWTYQHSLDGGKFGSRSVKDLDLLNPMRELIYKSRVFRQPDSIGSSWIELRLLLFDNYLVLAKLEKAKSSRRQGDAVRYIINRRPIPIELLSLGSFNEAPRTRPTGKLFGVGAAEEAADGGMIWPLNILFIGQGQLGGQYTLFAESLTIRNEWHEKLQHAKVLRAEVNDAGKVFELTPLSTDTFFQPSNYTVVKDDPTFTGRVTCSMPFTTPDRRFLVAIGCEEGVWIGLRHDPSSLRKVLHVKAVTHIAVLEEFGIFLVLQDKSLLAYHLEALVPSGQSPPVRTAPQRLSPGKDIIFFTVGQLSGRTLVLYMKRKGNDSLFRVLEPITNRNDDNRQRRPFGNLLGQRTEWFRLYKDFFIPTEALAVHFLKHKLAVVCAKGFEIMDLTDLKGGSIPVFDPARIRDRPHLAEIQRRCDSARPLGMFRSTETEFFLCYDSFGLYVDRHGEPNRNQEAIEWEGRPDTAAFHPPYLLLISAQFIEIRHIDTAKLVQIYTGGDIRLTWDGTGGQARPLIDNPGPKGYGAEVKSQEPNIHICQRPETQRSRGMIGQHVFELTPTLLLNNPLLNANQTHDSNYFPPAPLVQRPASIITSHSELYSHHHTPPHVYSDRASSHLEGPY